MSPTRRFTPAELDAHRGHTVADLIGPDCALLFVGINPSLWSAAVDAHFARPGNRFWPALFRAGILPRTIDPRDGLSDADRETVLRSRIGITNLVARASARADELSADELRAGMRRFVDTVGAVRPRVVAIAGITAYRQAFDERRARPGPQSRTLDGADTLWVVPNPSGLNAHETVESLAQAYRAAARAAGLVS